MDGMMEAGGDDESSSSSSSYKQGVNLDCQLDQFRAEWQNEIRASSPSQSDIRIQNIKNNEETKEEKAKELFLQGVQAEQIGAMNRAVNFYRQAIILVPDIESKIEYFRTDHSRERQESESSTTSSNEYTEHSGAPVEYVEDDFDIDDLFVHFRRLRVVDNNFCFPDYEPTGGHISDLPVEVLMYIFKWVISIDLDMRMVEQLSEVCRGFYLCARDEGLWKRACKRIWGVNSGRPNQYGSWRTMYISRPHVHCNGVYISRMTYVRHGEQGLEPGYQPVYIVEYFRYFRFFSNGTCTMVVSGNDPITMVTKLQTFNVNETTQGLMFGHYKLAGNKVTVVMKRHANKERNIRYRRNHRNNPQQQEEQKFHLELTICDAGKRAHGCLLWNHYMMTSLNKLTGQESSADFELKMETYPPMYFSRVKSYTSTTNSLLE